MSIVDSTPSCKISSDKICTPMLSTSLDCATSEPAPLNLMPFVSPVLNLQALDSIPRSISIKVEQKQIFFGRRKGRGLRPNPYARTLQRLESLSVQRWQGQWPKELWLEIGFGSGEHLSQWLLAHPTRAIIGVEVFLNGVVHCVDHLSEEVQNRCAIFSNPIQELWPLLSESILDGIILFFPDPWPKNRHCQRRMVQPDFLNQCAHYIKPGGEFHFASDHHALIHHVLKTFHAHSRWDYSAGAATADPDTWPQWPEDWPSSRYRDKALAQNTPCAFSIWNEQSSNIHLDNLIHSF